MHRIFVRVFWCSAIMFCVSLFCFDAYWVIRNVWFGYKIKWIDWFLASFVWFPCHVWLVYMYKYRMFGNPWHGPINHKPNAHHSEFRLYVKACEFDVLEKFFLHCMIYVRPLQILSKVPDFSKIDMLCVVVLCLVVVVWICCFIM